MQILAILLIGFSIFCALLLAFSNLLSDKAPAAIASKLAGFILLLSLAMMQWCHLGLVLGTGTLVSTQSYVALLYCVAPAFYFYSRQLLIIDCRYKAIDLAHFIPIIVGILLSYTRAFPLAFVIGSAYVLWLAKIIYNLRQQRRRFRLELGVLAIFFVIAIAVLVLAFAKPLIASATFFSSYAILIGLAFFAAALTLLRFPLITDEVVEAVQANYAQSTLNKIDRAGIVKQLEQLMVKDKIYSQESLDLATLAGLLAINPHQLSELINTEFGKGFSRFIREYRVDEAKGLLLSEPNSSVLSIGLSVGFTAQSNFYAAFRERVGMAPGEFRKHN